MYFDAEFPEDVFETQDGDKYWAEDGANYIGGTGTVVFNCLSSDGTETSDTFGRVEALGLAINLARAAGVIDPALLLLLEDKKQKLFVADLLKEFSLQERGNINLVCIGLFGVQLTDLRMTEELIKAVITEYQKEES